MSYDQVVDTLAHGIEAVGIGVILVGALLGTARFVRGWRSEGIDHAYPVYRSDLGRAILLGLEFLVAADIIATITIELTFRNLGALAVLVLVRTFLSFSLEVEISGHLPWQRSRLQGMHEPSGH